MTRLAALSLALVALALWRLRRDARAWESMDDDTDWLAEGGPIAPADWYLVGQSGPEMLVMGDFGYVIPAHRN